MFSKIVTAESDLFTALQAMYCIFHSHSGLVYGPFDEVSEARKWARTRFGSSGWNAHKLQRPDNQQKTRFTPAKAGHYQ